MENPWFPLNPNDQFIKNRGGASPGASRVTSLRSKVSPLGMLKVFSSWMEQDGTGWNRIINGHFKGEKW
jgi:hypothetical protein